MSGAQRRLRPRARRAAAIARFEHQLEHCAACDSRLEPETALGRMLRHRVEAPAPPRLQRRLRKLIDGL